MTTLTADQIAEIAARADAVKDANADIDVKKSKRGRPKDVMAVAEFLKAAPADIPALLAHIRALEARLAERTSMLDDAKAMLDLDDEAQRPGSDVFALVHRIGEELREPKP